MVLLENVIHLGCTRHVYSIFIYAFVGVFVRTEIFKQFGRIFISCGSDRHKFTSMQFGLSHDMFPHFMQIITRFLCLWIILHVFFVCGLYDQI